MAFGGALPAAGLDERPLGDLFTPSSPTPGQHGVPECPELWLVAAVLQDAILLISRRTAVGGLPSTAAARRQAARAREEARRWVELGTVGPLSFFDCCAYLRLEPSPVRVALLRRHHRGGLSQPRRSGLAPSPSLCFRRSAGRVEARHPP